MNTKELIHHRLIRQCISDSTLSKPQQVVEWMIAMQAQEYTMAKWAIGLRSVGLTEQLVEAAFNEGALLRTHVMRPTWHFVSPNDIRWLLALTKPRVHALNAFYYKKRELDTKILNRATELIARCLRGNHYLTRKDIQAVLAKSKIAAEGERLSSIMMYAELEGIICSGPRQGKQFTYAVLDERAAAATPFDRRDALAAFAKRYFTTRGPATAKDFAYWSGLTVKDAREGIEALPSTFCKETINDEMLVYLPSQDNTKARTSTFLMPDYDEYGMSYRNRDAIVPPGTRIEGSTAFSHWLVVNGVIAGTWDRIENNKKITVQTHPSGKRTAAADLAISKASRKYIQFFNGWKT